MPTLTLMFKNNVIKEYPLEKGTAVTIGRRDTNDIVIENLAVSGHHCKIDSVEEGFLLTDLHSKNGTFINDQQVTAHWLKHEDEIVIGKHKLVFAYGADEAIPQDAPGESAVEMMDKTMVMDSVKKKELLSKPDPSGTQILKDTSEEGQIGVLSYLAGGEGELELNKKLTKIGKDPASDIVIGGLMTGQTAATISKRPTGFYLSYVTGMTKPKVNNETVRESVQLKEFDVIEVGGAKLQFIFKS